MTKLIVVAGIKRSGSTLIFNTIRLLCEGIGTVYCSGNYREDITTDYYIIKKHSFNPELAKLADIIITSDRNRKDIEDSLERFYNKKVKMNRMATDLKKWNKYSSYCIDYNDLMDNRLNVIKKLKTILNIEVVSPQIMKELIK